MFDRCLNCATSDPACCHKNLPRLRAPLVGTMIDPPTVRLRAHLVDTMIDPPTVRLRAPLVGTMIDPPTVRLGAVNVDSRCLVVTQTHSILSAFSWTASIHTGYQYKPNILE